MSSSVVSVLVETTELEVAPASQTPQGAKIAPRQGTGMVLSPEGHIITAVHMVDKAGKVTVVFNNGSQSPAQVVGRDLRTAVALLKVTPASALVPVRFADSRQLRRGQPIFAIGNPFGLQGSISSGLISALRRTGGPVPVIQTDGAVHPGNDGGPLFNLNGDVIGMVSSVYSVSGAPTNIGYATPSNVVKEVAEKLQRSGVVERGWLGVQVRKPTEQETSSLALERGTGAIIMKVSEGGPAAKSGLVAGDIIATFVGQPVREIDEFAWAIDDHAPDTEVTLGIVRKTGRSDVRVRLGRLNELQPSPASAPATEKSSAKAQECVRYIPDAGLTVPVSCGE